LCSRPLVTLLGGTTDTAPQLIAARNLPRCESYSTILMAQADIFIEGKPPVQILLKPLARLAVAFSKGQTLVHLILLTARCPTSRNLFLAWYRFAQQRVPYRIDQHRFVSKHLTAAAETYRHNYRAPRQRKIGIHVQFSLHLHLILYFLS
jgi:hypothetical protein